MTNGTITNPILPGFNPDPSILRVEDDYYIATSTFEWFPGVQIHHSKDLVNWRLLTHPLRRESQLKMAGNPSSGGIWAPCLTYDQGIFYLIYTDVKSHSGAYKDTHNYLVTATDIEGEWSEPIYLNSSGFDPSLFHDDDGKKWLVNMQWDYRLGRNSFSGIVMQEYSVKEKCLIGEIKNIFLGTELGKTEGPHIYKKDGFYYLMTAEGGTGLEHAVTMARSKTLEGPYEVAPNNPILTSKHNPLLPIQKSGHASLVETQTGEWYMVHLCSRPIPTKGRSILGRETAIQKMKWQEDGWIYLACGGNEPELNVEAPDLPAVVWDSSPERDDFNSTELGIDFATLRVPASESFMSLTQRPGYLRLLGGESLSSVFHQSIVARRQQAFKYQATTSMAFEPEHFLQMAGLICIYDRQNYYYLRVSHDEEVGISLGILYATNNQLHQPVAEIPLESFNQIYLRADVDYDELQFSYSLDLEEWKQVGPILDISTLSDEYCREGCFTGAFVGMCCQDMSGRKKAADFDWFEYREID